MSNPFAISAVTSTLRNLLDQAGRDNPAGTVVTTRPPDRARTAITGSQLNLFLYHTSVDAAWRNRDVPGRVGPGEHGTPPLPLVLSYLITAYGENDDETVSHRVLGRAMGALHDHPVLSAADVRGTFTAAELAEVDLQDQVESVRVTYQPMSLEEMSKLWTAFQTQYRVSAAYRVAVVLIDSSRRRASALPVLRQGDDGRGPAATAGLTPPFPALTAVETAQTQNGAQLGEPIRLRGHHLAGDDVSIRFRTRLLPDPLVLSPDPTPAPTDETVTVTLPLDAAARAAWVAGLYTVEVAVGRDVPAPGGAGVVRSTRTTNLLPLAVVSRVTAIAPQPPVRDARGDVPLTVTVEPLVRPGQRAVLLFGDAELPAVPPAPPPPPAPPVPPAPAATLAFLVPAPAAGTYPVRVRVDGVDSRLVVDTAEGLRFDPAMQVVVP